ncbi:MAG: flavin reductase family protein, partial [Planctomycetia bacterium]|nr:flavin reductase family protein [Planctomycetia bacterium]
MESSDSLEAQYQSLERELDREPWVVTSTDGAQLGGLIATNVSQASIVPALPRVLVGISRRHRTWELIEASGAFALHMLGEEHLDWVIRFGLQSGREADKFAGLESRPGRSGSPILT